MYDREWNFLSYKKGRRSCGSPFVHKIESYLSLIAACAAASLAMGTRTGEQET